MDYVVMGTGGGADERACKHRESMASGTKKRTTEGVRRHSAPGVSYSELSCRPLHALPSPNVYTPTLAQSMALPESGIGVRRGGRRRRVGAARRRQAGWWQRLPAACHVPCLPAAHEHGRERAPRPCHHKRASLPPAPANRKGRAGVGHSPSPLLPCTCCRKASQEASSRPACLRDCLAGRAERSASSSWARMREVKPLVTECLPTNLYLRGGRRENGGGASGGARLDGWRAGMTTCPTTINS